MDDSKVLDVLPAADDRELMTLPFPALLSRVVPFETQWKAEGLWHAPHPWFDAFVPDEAVDELITETVADMRHDEVGAGVVLLFPFHRERLRRPLLRMPDDELVWLFDILRFPPRGERRAAELLERNRTLFERARDLGATRYAISAIPFDDDDWRRHYGEQWDSFQARKRELDPHGILAPGQGIPIE